MRSSLSLFAPALFLLAAACTPEPEPEDVQPGADSALAAAEASSALAHNLDFVDITDSFAGSELLATLPVRLARARALGDAVGAMLAAVRDVSCVSVDGDQESFVEVSFDACPVGLFRLRELDGVLRAELDFDTAPCGAEECPVAVRFTLITPRLRIGSRLTGRFVELEGSWELRDTLAAGGETTWTAGVVTTDHRDRRQSMSSRASWVVDGACTTMSLDTELSVDGLDELGTIAASARDLTRCANACPASGTVRLAYGLGHILTWRYDGSDVATVEGPRGRRVALALGCDE